MTQELYGKTESEKLSDDADVAHQIVREIDAFGISDRQRWLLVYYLVLGVENVDEMQEVSACIKEVKGKEIFITGMTQS